MAFRKFATSASAGGVFDAVGTFAPIAALALAVGAAIYFPTQTVSDYRVLREEHEEMKTHLAALQKWQEDSQVTSGRGSEGGSRELAQRGELELVQ